jgi:hypothetical protein
MAYRASKTAECRRTDVSRAYADTRPRMPRALDEGFLHNRPAELLWMVGGSGGDCSESHGVVQADDLPGDAKPTS